MEEKATSNKDFNIEDLLHKLQTVRRSVLPQSPACKTHLWFQKNDFKTWGVCYMRMLLVCGISDSFGGTNQMLFSLWRLKMQKNCNERCFTLCPQRVKVCVLVDIGDSPVGTKLQSVLVAGFSFKL